MSLPKQQKQKGKQPSRIDKTKELIEQMKQEKEKELLQDERIQQKIQEYEDKKASYVRLIEEKEAELREKEKELKAEYETLKI
jgi:hypothetical protein